MRWPRLRPKNLMLSSHPQMDPHLMMQRRVLYTWKSDMYRPLHRQPLKLSLRKENKRKLNPRLSKLLFKLLDPWRIKSSLKSLNLQRAMPMILSQMKISISKTNQYKHQFKNKNKIMKTQMISGWSAVSSLTTRKSYTPRLMFIKSLMMSRKT